MLNYRYSYAPKRGEGGIRHITDCRQDPATLLDETCAQANVEFGRYAGENRAKRKEGKPETFAFFGPTHL